MPALTTDPGLTITSFPTQTVEMIDYLGNVAGWTAVPYLFCEHLELAANGYDKARLRYEIGQGVLQPGAGTFAAYTPLSIRGKYVRITILDPVNGNSVWIGYCPIDELQRDGVVTVDGVKYFKGEAQIITAVGLEYFLDRNQVDDAVVHNQNVIERALIFNGGPNHDLDPLAGPRGNRKSSLDASGLYYDFTDDPTAGVLWTAGQIVKHLLAYQAPRDSVSAGAPCIYTLSATDDAAGMLECFTPTIATERQTVFQLLNQICSPQRGLVWFASTTYTNSTTFGCTIRVATAAVSNITMPGSGGTFPANATPKSLDFDSEKDVVRCDLKANGSRIYHKVIVRGERMTGTGTVGMQDSTLVIDWTSAMETEYKAAASADGDYGGLSLSQQKDRNDAQRKADRYLGVFSHFRIPADWNGKTGDGGTATRDWLLAELDGSGLIVGGLPINPQGMRLLQKTRFKQGWDYSNPSSPVSKTVDTSLAPFAPPFAVVKVENDASPANERWQYVEHLNKPKFHVGVAVGYGIAGSAAVNTTYHLSMLQTVPGIALNAQGGLNHSLALNHWSGAAVSDQKTEVDYDTLRATVTMEADLYAEGIYFPTPPTNTPLEILVVDVGEHYRLDFVAKNTVVEVRNGQLILTSDAAVLRDDRPTLRDLARIAYEWYRMDRVAVEIEFRQLRNIWNLGWMITTLGAGTVSTTCNTVISRIVYDFKKGTTTITTADDTLDVRSLAGGRRRA